MQDPAQAQLVENLDSLAKINDYYQRLAFTIKHSQECSLNAYKVLLELTGFKSSPNSHDKLVSKIKLIISSSTTSVDELVRMTNLFGYGRHQDPVKATKIEALLVRAKLSLKASQKVLKDLNEPSLSLGYNNQLRHQKSLEHLKDALYTWILPDKLDSAYEKL